MKFVGAYTGMGALEKNKKIVEDLVQLFGIKSYYTKREVQGVEQVRLGHKPDQYTVLEKITLLDGEEMFVGAGYTNPSPIGEFVYISHYDEKKEITYLYSVAYKVLYKIKKGKVMEAGAHHVNIANEQHLEALIKKDYSNFL